MAVDKTLDGNCRGRECLRFLAGKESSAPVLPASRKSLSCSLKSQLILMGCVSEVRGFFALNPTDDDDPDDDAAAVGLVAT